MRRRPKNSLRGPSMVQREKAPISSTPRTPDLTAGMGDDQIICHCTQNTKGTLLSYMTKCRHDPDRLADRTGASTKCGTCRDYLEELCEVTPIQQSWWNRLMTRLKRSSK